VSGFSRTESGSAEPHVLRKTDLAAASSASADATFELFQLAILTPRSR
jgi:hypothetical protein